MLIVTYNIQYTCGRDGAYDLQRIVDTVADADIICLQEVENWWDRSGNIAQSDEISRRLPDHYAVWGPTIDVLKVSGREALSPASQRRRQFGNMILSRYPIVSSRNHMFPKFTTPGPQTIQRGAVEAVIAAPGGALRVYSTHLDHMSGRQRLIQLQNLVDVSNRAIHDGPAIAGRDAPWLEGLELPEMPREAVICGDMNFEPTSDEYGWMAGHWNQLRGYMPDSAGFTDAHMAAGHAIEEGHTLYDDFDAKRGERIDYCFVSTSFANRVVSCNVDREAVGSDHQPVRIVLDI
jgi:endonuclease/exonuclease/phosphatase family metal-dependent hydrolase